MSKNRGYVYVMVCSQDVLIDSTTSSIESEKVRVSNEMSRGEFHVFCAIMVEDVNLVRKRIDRVLRKVRDGRTKFYRVSPEEACRVLNVASYRSQLERKNNQFEKKYSRVKEGLRIPIPLIGGIRLKHTTMWILCMCIIVFIFFSPFWGLYPSDSVQVGELYPYIIGCTIIFSVIGELIARYFNDL